MRRRACLAALAVALALPALAPAGAHGARPLQTGIVDGEGVFGSQPALAFARMRAAGATTVRLYVPWPEIAPAGAVKPPGFDPANPADPHYRWATLDRQIRLAVANRLQPIISPVKAPSWAERGPRGDLPGGTIRPDPAEFAAFGRALALRFSGRFGGLPRVRFYVPWNEGNVVLHLSPQFEADGRYVAPELYRALVEGFGAAVRSVHADNLVIAGALSSFTNPLSSAPLAFMRALFCLSPQNTPLPGCRPLEIDIWSHHPYTSGGPDHRAARANDVSLPDLPKMQRVLGAARRAGTLVSPRGLQLWVTEFSWDTRPPDPGAVPMRLHSRWVAEALYRLWRLGVSNVIWFSLRDQALNGLQHHQVYQSGLWFRCAGGFRCDRPKPSMTAFRFPFVAYRAGGRALVWGRTPWGRPGRVIVEQRVGGRWVRLAVLRTDRNGIFTARPAIRGRGDLRARLVGGRDRSLAFSLTRPPDFPVRPFGTPLR
jgi:hypothetical protein